MALLSIAILVLLLSLLIHADQSLISIKFMPYTPGYASIDISPQKETFEPIDNPLNLKIRHLLLYLTIFDIKTNEKELQAQFPELLMPIPGQKDKESETEHPDRLADGNLTIPCMVYSETDLTTFQNPQVGAILTFRPDESLIFTPLIPLKPNSTTRCLVQRVLQSGQSEPPPALELDPHPKFRLESAPLIQRFTADLNNEVEFHVKYSSTGLVHNGVREDLITITLTDLSPGLLIPFTLGFDRDSILRYDRIFYLSTEESKIIANYWASLRPTTTESSPNSADIPDVQSVSCSRGVSIIFQDGFKIMVENVLDDVAVCKIPVPIFSIMKVMTGIPSLDYADFNGRKIAVYLKLNDLRTIQGETVSNAATWDFTNKYMTAVSIKENHRVVYSNTDETDLDHNTVRLHYDVIITGKVPSFRIKQVHCDTNHPRNDDRIRDNDDPPARIAFYDKLLDRKGYLFHFQYNTSPVQTWLSDIYQSSHKPLYLDSDYKTAITENYHGYANVTIAFDIPMRELTYPFAIELEINDRPQFLTFLPDTSADIARLQYSDEEIVLRYTLGYKASKIMQLVSEGRINNPIPVQYRFNMPDYVVSHSFTLGPMVFFPIELRSSDMIDKVTCWQTFYGEDGGEVAPLQPLRQQMAFNEEALKVFSRDMAFFYELQGAAWRPGWTLQVKCTYKISPTALKPHILDVWMRTNIITGFNQRHPLILNQEVTPTGKWTTFPQVHEEAMIQVWKVEPIVSETDFDKLLDTIVSIFKSAEWHGSGQINPSMFDTIQKQHLSYVVKEGSHDMSFADQLAFPSHFYNPDEPRNCHQSTLLNNSTPSPHTQDSCISNNFNTTSKAIISNHIFSVFSSPGTAFLRLMAHFPDITTQHDGFNEKLQQHIFPSIDGVVINVSYHPSPIERGAPATFPPNPPSLDPPGFLLPATTACFSSASCGGECIEGRCTSVDIFPHPTVHISNYYLYRRFTNQFSTGRNVPGYVYNSQPMSLFTITDVDLPGGIQPHTERLSSWVIAVIVIGVVLSLCGIAYLGWTAVMRHKRRKDKNRPPQRLSSIHFHDQYSSSDDDSDDDE